MSIAAILAWKGWRRIGREVGISIVLGALIEIGLVVFQPPTLLIVRHVADETADRMIRLVEATTEALNASPAFIFIDIDDATWLAWNAPLITPRDKVATLISRAAHSHPTMIIVDIDLAFDDSPSSEGVLKALIKDYDPTWPPLLLTRSLKGLNGAQSGLPEPRLTHYEQTPDDGRPRPPNVIWASPLFERDGDAKVRRWRLAQPACDRTASLARPMVIPSLELAAAIILNSKGAEPAAAIGRAMAPIIPDSCEHPGPAKTTIIQSDPRIVIGGDDVAQRIIYRVGWRDGASALGPLVPLNGVDVSLVALRSARLIAAGDRASPIPGMDGRIAVIGGSFLDSGDWRDTPVGRMPGALMIINAIEALALNGTPEEPDLSQRLAISFGIIVAVSFLTALLRPILASFAAAGLIIAIMVASLHQFGSGIILDLSLPAVGAFVHDILETIVIAFQQIRQLGWRWILKPEAPAPTKPGEAKNA